MLLERPSTLVYVSIAFILYKLLTRIITDRLTNKFDFYQPVEQAGLQKGYSTIDHLQVIHMLIEKTTEYSIPLYMAFVDYEKAFDSIETWAILAALNKARIDSRYTSLVQHIYENAMFHVNIGDEMIKEKIPIKRGVRQGDTISPKLFTLALEGVFKNMSWDEKGINIDSTYLNHLRFADDIVLISSDPEELKVMIGQLYEKSMRVG